MDMDKVLIGKITILPTEIVNLKPSQFENEYTVVINRCGSVLGIHLHVDDLAPYINVWPENPFSKASLVEVR